MALTAFDFTKGVDFSALSSATGSDHNNLIDAGTPRSDSATEGKGLVIWTVDSALDTPIVPDAATTTKWKRYIWIRIPYTGAVIKTPVVYGWNDDAASDATLLKWLPTAADLSTVESDVATLQTDMDAAEAAIVQVNNTAINAGVLANQALNAANNAQTDATAALALAAEPPAAGSITADMLDSTLDLSAKTITLPAGSVTAGMLETILDLSGKTVTLPTASVTTVLDTRRYTSGQLNIAAGVLLNAVAHGLTSPVRAYANLVCITNDAATGHSAGDKVNILETISPGNACNYGVSFNDTTVSCYCYSTTVYYILKKDGLAYGTPTAANWKVVAYVEA